MTWLWVALGVLALGVLALAVMALLGAINPPDDGG